MARKRRARRPDTRPLRTLPEHPGWRWRTLPVWLALTGGFVAGFYVNLIGAGVDPGPIAWILLYLSVGGFSIGLSRIMRWLTERWIARRRARAAAAQARAPRPTKPT